QRAPGEKVFLLTPGEPCGERFLSGAPSVLFCDRVIRMMMLGPIVAVAVYAAVVGFGFWLAWTFVRAVVRISHAAERASWSLAEIAKSRAGGTNQPS
ncbi:MAG TPA: hypothetical protein VHA14_21215, partial [Bryobacteraceae bacterium]|nr:hypothetical protein [Bryobacteraceae bacterium]